MIVTAAPDIFSFSAVGRHAAKLRKTAAKADELKANAIALSVNR